MEILKKRMANKINNEGVIRTAHEAVNCKSLLQSYNMIAGVYIASSVSQYDVMSNKNQSPLVGKLYLSRVLCVHKFVEHGVNLFMLESSLENIQILQLGGGFDSSFEKYMCRNFVVDFSDVLSKRSPQRSVLIAADLRNISNLQEKLLQCEFKPQYPTIVVLESVMAYLDNNSASNLISFLNIFIPKCIIVIYDPILISDGSSASTLTSTLLERFLAHSAPLLSSKISPAHMSQFLRGAGWPHVFSTTVLQCLHILRLHSPPSPTPPMQIEPFDEFASLASLLRHYAISVCCNDRDSFARLMDAAQGRCENPQTTDGLNHLNARAEALAVRLLSLIGPRDEPSRQNQLLVARAATRRDLEASLRDGTPLR